MIRNRRRKDLVELDASEVIHAFESLTGKERDKIFRVELRKAAMVLVNETDIYFKKKIKQSTETISKVSKTGKKTISKRKVAKIKMLREGVGAKVHIMADYKAKWFEMGTRERVTKGNRRVGYFRLRSDSNRRYFLRLGKPAKRGALTPGHFFRDAQRSKEDEIFQRIDTDISKAIIKRYNKR